VSPSHATRHTSLFKFPTNITSGNAKFLHGTHYDYDVVFSRARSRTVVHLVGYEKIEKEVQHRNGELLRSSDPARCLTLMPEEALSALLRELMDDVDEVVKGVRNENVRLSICADRRRGDVEMGMLWSH
jgi:hypothetical protein